MTDSGQNAAPASRGYSTGDVIAGKYRLDAMLGEGGQALVWRARNLALDIDVALKLVRPDAEDRGPVNRLLREARAAARLGHPAIVRVFDLGETAAGDPFLVMELLSGQDLATLLVARQRLPPVEAVRTLLPIADALVTAHAEGIVHRDLKPANVYLARSGDSLQPKLLDFGIVKIQKPVSRPEAITNDGVVIGSLAYLSPEQARGLATIDERADVWGFCAMLYECLTGSTPFQGSSFNQMLQSIVEDRPKSIVELGAGDAELWAILERGLAKAPEDRVQTLHELGAALAGWLVDQGVQDDISGVSLSSRWLRAQGPPVNPEQASPSSPADAGKTLAGASTEASVSSIPLGSQPASPSPSRSRWLVLGGVAVALVAVGLLVERAQDASSPDSRALQELSTSGAAAEKPLERSERAPGEPVVVPAHTASALPSPEAAPAPAASAALSPEVPARTPAPAQALPPSGRFQEPRRPAAPPPASKPSDLLNPY